MSLTQVCLPSEYAEVVKQHSAAGWILERTGLAGLGTSIDVYYHLTFRSK